MEDTDDVLEFFPPVTEENEEEQEIQTKEELEEKVTDGYKLRRLSCKFDVQHSEEGKTLRNKRKQNSNSTAVPEEPPLFKTQATVTLFTKSPEDDASKLLHKALSDNPYNKLHQKYNPNLVKDENSDLAALLKIRRLRTRRLSLLAMHKKDSETPLTRRLSVTEEHIQMNNPVVALAASSFLENAQRRLMLKRETMLTQEGVGASSSPTSNKSTKLERQCAINMRSGSNGTLSTAVEESDANVIERPSRERSPIKKKHCKSNETVV